jgi:hypothetical protein
MKFVIYLAGLAALGVAALSICGPARAVEPTAFQNTILVEVVGGSTFKRYIEPNGTFTDKRSDGTTNSGTWREDGDQTCFKAKGEPEFCNPNTEHKVGETWTNGHDGQVTAFVTLVAGRD